MKMEKYIALFVPFLLLSFSIANNEKYVGTKQPKVLCQYQIKSDDSSASTSTGNGINSYTLGCVFSKNDAKIHVLQTPACILKSKNDYELSLKNGQKKQILALTCKKKNEDDLVVQITKIPKNNEKDKKQKKPMKPSDKDKKPVNPVVDPNEKNPINTTTDKSNYDKFSDEIIFAIVLGSTFVFIIVIIVTVKCCKKILENRKKRRHLKFSYSRNDSIKNTERSSYGSFIPTEDTRSLVMEEEINYGRESNSSINSEYLNNMEINSEYWSLIKQT